MKDHKYSNTALILNLDVDTNSFSMPSTVEEAIADANTEIQTVETIYNETIESIKRLTPACDKLDYALAAGSGVLCGLFDVFLVGKPRLSPIGKITDKWCANTTVRFAKLLGYNPHKGTMADGEDNLLRGAIKFLETEFKIPYDQTHGGEIFKALNGLSPRNHHFKSLGHNPSLLGLFFSILNQFLNTSSFIADGQLIHLKVEGDASYLVGTNFVSKLFCGVKNWLGHMMSDVSGSSGSKGRGMGIPSPLWTWVNSVIALKRMMHIPPSEFDKNLNQLAVKVFEHGFDARFQITQMIPVFLNETIVRLFYATRRAIGYFKETPEEDRSFTLLWKTCNPFSGATVKRMLTVAHGTFCLVDVADATVRGFLVTPGAFNPVEFFLRLNVAGIGRFTISLYGEARGMLERRNLRREAALLLDQKSVAEDYLNGAKHLAEIYSDNGLLTFVNDFKHGTRQYEKAFQKSIQLAQHREVLNSVILSDKSDIDKYFRKG